MFYDLMPAPFIDCCMYSLSDNTARLTSAMTDLPMLLEKKRLIDMHTSLATAILDSKIIRYRASLSLTSSLTPCRPSLLPTHLTTPHFFFIRYAFICRILGLVIVMINSKQYKTMEYTNINVTGIYILAICVQMNLKEDLKKGREKGGKRRKKRKE